MVGSSSVEVSRYAAQDVIMAGGVGGLGPGRWGGCVQRLREKEGPLSRLVRLLERGCVLEVTPETLTCLMAWSNDVR